MPVNYGIVKASQAVTCQSDEQLIMQQFFYFIESFTSCDASSKSVRRLVTQADRHAISQVTCQTTAKSVGVTEAMPAGIEAQILNGMVF